MLRVRDVTDDVWSRDGVVSGTAAGYVHRKSESPIKIKREKDKDYPLLCEVLIPVLYHARSSYLQLTFHSATQPTVTL